MEEIRQEIIDFNLQFPQFAHFRITDKIGEGTFSSVYLAVDLKHYHYANCAHTDPDCCIVALKRIYPNSSPSRILNELATLRELGHHPNIATLIEVMRHQDQIVAVLPFFAHDLFRDYFRHLDTAQIRTYLGGLLLALERVHRCRIIHRDIKPSNFLYNVAKGKGVLVDFGLAQVFNLIQKQALGRLEKPSGPHRGPKGGYIEDDPRPSVRASRAGTRGFRAPEVLFKVVHQTTGTLT